MRRSTPLLLAALGTLALAGCSGSAPDTTAPDTVTQTETAETVIVESSPGTTEPESSMPESSPSGTPTAGSTTTPAEGELPMEPVGSRVTINGEPATVCIYGDGYGTNVWAGNASTSCEFVSAVHRELIEGVNATEDNIRDHLKPQIRVTSPVTGEEYDLSCTAVDQRLLSCTGGEGAAVYFY